MPTLTEAAFLAHLAACSTLHPVASDAPPRDVLAVARHESGMNILAIGINADRRRSLPASSHSPDTVEEAKSIVRRALADGRRVDVGVMQITDSNWQAYGLSLDTIFDPAANVCAGARLLGEAFQRELEAARRAARCRYNTGRPNCSNGYPEAVAAMAARPLRPFAAEPPAAAVEASLPPPPPAALSAFSRRPAGAAELPPPPPAPPAASASPTRLAERTP